MQNTSTSYKSLFSNPSHKKEWRAKIFDPKKENDPGQEYAQESLVSINLRNQLYGNALIGNACSGQMDLCLRPEANSPGMLRHVWERYETSFCQFQNSGTKIGLENYRLYKRMIVSSSDNYPTQEIICDESDFVDVEASEVPNALVQGYCYYPAGFGSFGIFMITSFTQSGGSWQENYQTYVYAYPYQFNENLTGEWNPNIPIRGKYLGLISSDNSQTYQADKNLNGYWYVYLGEKTGKAKYAWDKSYLDNVAFFYAGTEYVYEEELEHGIVLFKKLKEVDKDSPMGGILYGFDSIRTTIEEAQAYIDLGYCYYGQPNIMYRMNSIYYDDDEESWMKDYDYAMIYSSSADLSIPSDYIEIVFAEQSDTYPQDGSQDGFYYTYSGEAFEEVSVGIPRMAKVELEYRLSIGEGDIIPTDILRDVGIRENYSENFYYSTEANIVDGAVSLVDPQEVDFLSARSVLLGKYWKFGEDGNIHLTPENASIRRIFESGYIVYYIPSYSEFSPAKSEWIPKGTYWIDTREEDPRTNVVTLHCVDAMMFGEQEYFPPESDVPPWSDETMRTVARECAEKMGIELEDETQFQNASPYVLTAPPFGYTVREVLSGIAAAHGGNVIITPTNELRLLSLIPTDTGIDLENNMADFLLSKKYEPFGQVVFNFESDEGETLTVLYPDIDTPDGPVIETTMLGMTDSEKASTIVQTVYNAIKNYAYAPYKAQDAIIDPAMELGDGLTINGTYSVLASLDEICDALYSASIEAPSYEETDHEFVYESRTNKTLDRKLAKSTASIKIGIDSIEQMIVGLAPDWAPDTQYQLHDLVKHNGLYYTCTTAHTSGSSFDSSKWSEGTDQATLQNSIKLNIADGLVLSSDAGSDENSCYIQLKYGNITLFAQDILMNNVTAERLKAQTINAQDVNVAGALEFYGSLDYPGYQADTYYRVGDRIYDRLLINPLQKTYREGVWECTTAHTSTTTFFLDYLNGWEFVGEVEPVSGGYMGFGTGDNGTTQPTKGVVMASSKESSYGSGDHYVIVTNSGVRLQSGSIAFYLAGGNIRYSLDGTNFQDLGYAVFSD